jgi:hypothetical protein
MTPSNWANHYQHNEIIITDYQYNEIIITELTIISAIYFCQEDQMLCNSPLAQACEITKLESSIQIRRIDCIVPPIKKNLIPLTQMKLDNID